VTVIAMDMRMIAATMPVMKHVPFSVKASL